LLHKTFSRTKDYNICTAAVSGKMT